MRLLRPLEAGKLVGAGAGGAASFCAISSNSMTCRMDSRSSASIRALSLHTSSSSDHGAPPQQSLPIGQCHRHWRAVDGVDGVEPCRGRPSRRPGSTRRRTTVQVEAVVGVGTREGGGHGSRAALEAGEVAPPGRRRARRRWGPSSRRRTGGTRAPPSWPRPCPIGGVELHLRSPSPRGPPHGTPAAYRVRLFSPVRRSNFVIPKRIS